MEYKIRVRRSSTGYWWKIERNGLTIEVDHESEYTSEEEAMKCALYSLVKLYHKGEISWIG